MSSSTNNIAGQAAVSGAVAAAIAMTISCVIWMIITGDPAVALTWGAWSASIGFCAPFAVIYFVMLAQRGRSAG